MRRGLASVFVAVSMFFVLPAYAAERAEENAEVAEDVQGLDAQAFRICRQPIVTGPCRAAFQRFAYNAAVGRCVPFTYGGCQGNENNFRSMRDCVNTCYRRMYRMP
ncbi:BPTI/Kunitz domain-containing protein [Polyangium spumosum]|uniref:BPTI/Kunitz inhibitor domain-containing protein n=1 Tax=Polyangium spumosum TaxID=889282 RepID=A0A6N7PQJ2_9BACT|nr:BPTI/Kunitz domain-containing protein [Polyangium spumosum]MRG91131.1 hypothetical protein [Polyangium spumosum]